MSNFSYETLNRLLSLVVVVGLSVAAAIEPPVHWTIRGFSNLSPAACAALMFVSSLPILALIWFPDFFGQMITTRIYPSTPSWLVAVCGWMLLLGVPLLTYWLRRE